MIKKKHTLPSGNLLFFFFCYQVNRRPLQAPQRLWNVTMQQKRNRKEEEEKRIINWQWFVLVYSDPLGFRGQYFNLFINRRPARFTAPHFPAVVCSLGAAIIKNVEEDLKKKKEGEKKLFFFCSCFFFKKIISQTIRVRVGSTTYSVLLSRSSPPPAGRRPPS